jgi:hypothetical protein
VAEYLSPSSCIKESVNCLLFFTLFHLSLQRSLVKGQKKKKKWAGVINLPQERFSR